jgi:hypothetical protein
MMGRAKVGIFLARIYCPAQKKKKRDELPRRASGVLNALLSYVVRRNCIPSEYRHCQNGPIKLVGLMQPKKCRFNGAWF